MTRRNKWYLVQPQLYLDTTCLSSQVYLSYTGNLVHYVVHFYMRY